MLSGFVATSAVNSRIDPCSAEEGSTWVVRMTRIKRIRRIDRGGTDDQIAENIVALRYLMRHPEFIGSFWNCTRRPQFASHGERFTTAEMGGRSAPQS